MRRALVLLILCGCGSPIAGSDYRGVPKFTTRVNATWNGAGDPPDGGMMVAMFLQPTRESVDPSQWTELVGSTTPVPAAPSNVTMNLFALPADAQLVQGQHYGIARVVAYVDANGDGHFDRGDALLGIEPPFAWVYAPQPLDADASPTGNALPAGFHHLYVPQHCAAPPGPTTPGNCGVPLGERCTEDADCTGGVCIKETKFPWPAGYCAIAEPVLDGGCRPGDGVYEGAPRYSLVPPGVGGYWLRACQTDADCARPQDRDQNMYACDLGLRACLPTPGGIPMPMGDRFEVEPFCAVPRGPPPP